MPVKVLALFQQAHLSRREANLGLLSLSFLVCLLRRGPRRTPLPLIQHSMS